MSILSQYIFLYKIYINKFFYELAVKFIPFCIMYLENKIKLINQIQHNFEVPPR